MAKKRWSINDYKIVDATAVADWFEYTEVITPGSSSGASSFGVTTPSTNVAGMQNVLPVAVYNATPTTRTEWQAWPLQEDTLGNLLTSLGTLLWGEDVTRGIMKVQQRFQPYPISVAWSYQVKTWSGLLWKIIVQWGAAGTIKVYDNTSAVGTPILDFDSTAAIAPYDINAEFYVWCFVVTSANTKVTVMTGV